MHGNGLGTKGLAHALRCVIQVARIEIEQRDPSGRAQKPRDRNGVSTPSCSQIDVYLSRARAQDIENLAEKHWDMPSRIDLNR